MYEKIKSFVRRSIPEIVLASLSVLVGVLSAFLTKDNMQIYDQIKAPPLAPPAWLFPIAWGILYILMGIGAGMVYKRRELSCAADGALRLFFVQLAVNFFWSIIFFNLKSFWAALVVLVVLLLLVIVMTVRFYKIYPLAAYLQIPYILWLAFATYLNLAIAILN